MEEADDTDESLMLRYAQGDAAAFDALYGRHRGGVFRYLLRHLGGNRAAAEELFQDVWMNLIGARDRYRVEAKFTTWLYTMVHNRVIDHYRRQRPLEVVSLDGGEDDDPAPELAAPPTSQPERLAQARQEAARLLALVEALPAAQREVFLLHEEGGLSLEEIASVTGSDREAVKSRLRYAMDKLRRGMGDLL
jgi:RNA polymerase sigma-70 factor (ECF subfamily)